ncbi:MAG TPA: flavodoxin domain-containing protein [Amycolatopsis sp.]|jgi:menaquinone-dependent protoporphyrinogen oxidase|nr:flavodoxin domain-containing protein [Amycolatopsis sp.]
MRVLVAVATRHGATREVAEQIAASLRWEFEDAGVPAEVEVADAGRVGSFATYDAAVLGSAVYIGHWLEQARRLVHEHRGELSRIPVWLFSSGPVGEQPRTGEDPVDVSDVVAASGPREHRLFGGRIDRSVLRFPERAVVAALRVKDGDNRDWPTIRAWGTAIARELSGHRGEGTGAGDLRPSGSGSPAASPEQAPRVQ